MDTPRDQQPTQPTTLPETPPLNARESKKSMYLIAGIIISLLICLFLSFLLLSQIVTL